MSPSKILFYFCVAFVVGIFFESLIKVPQNFLWVFLILTVIFIFLSCLAKLAGAKITGQNYFIIVGFCGTFLVLGILRMQITEFDIQNDKLRQFNDSQEKVVFTGIIFDEPDVRDKSQKLKIKIRDSIVLATTSRYPEYKYLDEVTITGKLETPQAAEDFNYKNYLMKDGIYSVINFPKIERIGNKNSDFLESIHSKILWLKEKFRDSIYQNYSPPQSLILEGIMLGSSKNFTQDLRNKMQNTGLRFLTAISGTHIIILSEILMGLFLTLGLWRGQAFYFSLGLVWLYIVLTGMTASGIRAGIMGGIFLLSQKLGRQNTNSRIIFLAAALMLLQNPLLLFYDVGFQLSFLASLGIIYLKPLLKNLKIPDIVAVTLAAQTFTLPLIIFNFGNIPFSAPITSILVLPIIPALMSFGFLSLIFGIFSHVLGFIFSFPCLFLLDYFLAVLNIFSAPWLSKAIPNVSWIWMPVCYTALGISIWFLNKKYSKIFA